MDGTEGTNWIQVANFDADISWEQEINELTYPGGSLATPLGVRRYRVNITGICASYTAANLIDTWLSTHSDSGDDDAILVIHEASGAYFKSFRDDDGVSRNFLRGYVKGHKMTRKKENGGFYELKLVFVGVWG